jgi:hypothetical protein
MPDGRHAAMNALQQLIADYRLDTGEGYADIGRRAGIPRQTVQALATKDHLRQTPHPTTIAALARGMRVPVELVSRAAVEAAGYGGMMSEHLDGETRLLIIRLNEMDPRRKEDLFRRSRMLIEEMYEEREPKPGEG